MTQTASVAAVAEPTHQIPAIVQSLRARFDTGRTRDRRWREQQLDGILRFIAEREDEIREALAADLGKPAVEAFVAEFGFVRAETKHARKHLKAWMKPERVGTPLVLQPGKSLVHKDPLGVVLVISPWNYPFHLAMAPIVGAVAAGNCVLLKPSELAPHTSALLSRFLPHYMDETCVRVLEGGVEKTTELLKERFDHIFFTGSGRIGRIIMAAAAKHLTPVTLELGGKSPCVVDRTADLRTAARRIVWGKFSNAGQTCVAPDYVLVEREVHDGLLNHLVRTVREFYGDDPSLSPDFGRIINARHHQRLSKMLEGADGAGTAVAGGVANESEKYIAPTILRDVSPDAPVMQEEIFGPILPVLTVNDVGEAISFINQRDKPLALYLYTEHAPTQERVITETSSGGVSVNHVWLHLAVPELPFGGVGESGMGAYHGKRSFDVFTHHKAVLKKPALVDPQFMYPPYTEQKKKWLERLL